MRKITSLNRAHQLFNEAFKQSHPFYQRRFKTPQHSQLYENISKDTPKNRNYYETKYQYPKYQQVLDNHHKQFIDKCIGSDFFGRQHHDPTRNMRKLHHKFEDIFNSDPFFDFKPMRYHKLNKLYDLHQQKHQHFNSHQQPNHQHNHYSNKKPDNVKQEKNDYRYQPQDLHHQKHQHYSHHPHHYRSYYPHQYKYNRYKNEEYHEKPEVRQEESKSGFSNVYAHRSSQPQFKSEKVSRYNEAEVQEQQQQQTRRPRRNSRKMQDRNEKPIEQVNQYDNITNAKAQTQKAEKVQKSEAPARKHIFQRDESLTEVMVEGKKVIVKNIKEIDEKGKAKFQVHETIKDGEEIISEKVYKGEEALQYLENQRVQK